MNEEKDLDRLKSLVGDDIGISWEMCIELKPGKNYKAEDIMDEFDPSYDYDVDTMDGLIKFSGSIEPDGFEEANLNDRISSIRGIVEQEEDRINEKFYPVISSTSVDVYYW